MQKEKMRGQRGFIPVTPDYHGRKHSNTWLSIGSAIVLLSIIVAIILGFWAITF